MKKLIVITAVILSYCTEEASKETIESIAADSMQVEAAAPESVAEIDTLPVTDSVAEKITNLLTKTEHVEHKVKEIKAIKTENACLKKELVETKAELQELQEVLKDSSYGEVVKRKKKSFIQKVISTIKKDTVN